MPHIHIKAYTFFNLTSISCTFYRDLSRIPVNKGIKSRLGWTKHSDLYEILNLSLDLIFLCFLTGAECGKGLFGVI